MRWLEKAGGAAIQAGEYDTAVTLAFLFGWDYWQVEAQPIDYIEELLVRVQAQNEMNGTKRETIDETVARLRAANTQALRRMGVKPL